jgi:formylglycine-generating enzyme required for sulfatase activity
MRFIIFLNVLSCRQPEEGSDLVKTSKEDVEQEELEAEHLPEELQVSGLSFVLLDAATFLMGSPEEEAGRSELEHQHQVTLTAPYYISTTEVTRGLFLSYMSVEDEAEAICLEETCPIHFITWHEAVFFTNHLSQQEGFQACYVCEGEGKEAYCFQNPEFSNIYNCEGYRLPTEAEWEYAARAGTTAAIWTPEGGGELPEEVIHSCEAEWVFEDGTKLSDWAWFCANALHPNPVAQLLPNDWGLYDMSGNVWEWTHDSYRDYPEEAEENPTAPHSNGLMALRGGRWANEPYALRSSKRIHLAPTEYGNFGFRLVRRP